ncbi:unnamed protein product [Arabis nemorensis]|uniref:Gnk2-homologous domain-containing protein n=1 Tax=Arabis nemorensis TaxID=586526 RepID=A0A565CSZ2_9BRAS|nr:unnamed protein product [Arabis nemorensis]
MCILYSLSKHIVFVHILALQVLTRSVSSLNLTNAYLHHKCLDRKGKYQPGSEFEKHFTDVTESVPTVLNEEIAMSVGTAPNVITIIFQCRGDSYGSKCRSCYATAVAGV